MDLEPWGYLPRVADFDGKEVGHFYWGDMSKRTAPHCGFRRGKGSARKGPELAAVTGLPATVFLGANGDFCQLKWHGMRAIIL